MRSTPWALALLALSLPTPALSDPLRGLSIRDAVWNRTTNQAEAARAWRRYQADLDDDVFDARPPLRWRQPTAYGPLDPNGDRYGYRYGDRYGEAPFRDSDRSWPGRPTPLAVIPDAPQPLRRCGPGPALVGAAIGGGLGAALSDGARSRQWALPIGATVGGLLGGVLAGC